MASVLLPLAFLLYLCSFGHAHAGKETAKGSRHYFQQSHKIQVSSLLPSRACQPSKRGLNKRTSTLQVVHKHGPCYLSNQYKLNQTEILLQDQSRVNSIHARLSKNKMFKTSATAATLPAKSGLTIGTGNYIVTISLGTPAKPLTLTFDTGSSLTWTQCEPCAGTCYKQQDPIFNPTGSSSYTNITCDSPSCSLLLSGTGKSPRCFTSTCIYSIEYGDNSVSEGYFATETLTLTPTDIFPKFLFGCGQNNGGLFRGSAGLIGLGRDGISIIEQSAQQYNKIFSYCLPSSQSSTGHLTFGNAAITPSVQFTPFSKANNDTSFYQVDMTGICVGGKQLTGQPGSLTVVVDSGTVITRLPSAVYAAMRDEFRRLMSEKGYQMANPFSLFDTCYDFSRFGSLDSVTVPGIGFVFGGGVSVDLEAKGILYVKGDGDLKQVCLAFAGNEDPSDPVIYGNVQQKGFEVVYDVAGQRVGFGPKACA